MISDDKRREVARRLRDGGIARNSEDAYVLLLSRIGIRPQLPATSTYEDAMARLADLIEPAPERTCRMVHRFVRPLLEYRGFCSKCGWMFPFRSECHYCQNCGARVVSGGSA